MSSTVQETGPSGQDDHGNCNNHSSLDTETELATIIEDWQRHLVVWASNGQLSHAAQVALQLPADHPGLQGFVSRIGRRDFRDLPPVRCLGPEAMEESPCAYSPERQLILINSDWLDHALAEQVIAVLSEELGHHLDVLFNPVDTPGDEGELFLECLRGDISAESIAMFRRHNEESGVVHLEGEDLIVDEVGVGAMCLDLRDLSHQDAPQP